MRHATVHPVIGAALAGLEEAAVGWCVLRGESERGSTREIDLLIAPDDLSVALRLLADAGFAPVPAWGYGSHRFSVAYDAASDRWLKLDMVTEVSYGRHQQFRTGAAAACLARRRHEGGLASLAPDDAFWTLLLHCLLDRRDIPLRHRERLSALASTARSESPFARFVEAAGAEQRGARRILDCVRSADWGGLTALRAEIAANWPSSRDLRGRQRILVNGSLRRSGKLLRLLQRRGLRVALLGPDGSGKSTLAVGLESSFFFPARRLYGGLYPRRSRKRRWKRIGALRLAALLVDLRTRSLLASYHQARGRLVIFDRYTYDALLPADGASRVHSRLRRWLLAHACPAPDLVVLLDVPGEAAFLRKGEHSPAALDEQRRGYGRLRERVPKLIAVDASDGVDEVRRSVTASIWERYLERARRRGRRAARHRGRRAPKPSTVGNRPERPSSSRNGTAPRRRKVAYVMSRFPKLTETFVLYEILALENQGFDVAIYPLLRGRVDVLHPDAAPLVGRANFQPFVSWPIVRSQLYYLRRSPRTYLRTLWAVTRGTWGSANFFLGALAIFPKVAHASRLMSAEGIDHVHCHFANHPALAGFIVRRLTGIPYSFTAHGSDLHVDRHMLGDKVREAAFVGAISEYNRELIARECGARDNVHVIHCGVDTTVFRPRTRPVTSGARFTILCIGTLHEVKGQGVLVDACRILAEQGADFSCQLVGDGPDEGSLRGQIRAARLEDRISLLGAKTREEVAGLLAHADVLVAPSVPTRSGKREGIPVVLMEAMASGVPVVASRLSGIPELVEDGETGLLAPPRDAPALAAALERLFADRGLRERLAAAARDKVVRDFDLTTNAATLATHFTTVSVA